MGNKGRVTFFCPPPVVDDQVANKKYVDDNSGAGVTTTKGDLSGFAAVAARIPIGVNDQVLTADSVQALGLKWADAAAGGSDFTDRIPLVMEVPEGTVAFANVRALATAGAKISGAVLPDGAAVSSFNFKCNVPNDLASTPAASIKLIIIGLGVGTADNVRLTVKTRASGDAESVDTAFTSETETTVPIPNAAEVIEIYDQDMTTDPTAGDLLTVQVDRDPTDGSDDYAADIMIIGAYLEIDRTAT